MRTPGAQAAERYLATREVRSYELAHVHALWHADFHIGSRRVLYAKGRYHRAHLLGVLDDCSRLVCHAQWYLAEAAKRNCGWWGRRRNRTPRRRCGGASNEAAPGPLCSPWTGLKAPGLSCSLGRRPGR